MTLIITSVLVSLVMTTLAFYVYCLATRNGKKKVMIVLMYIFINNCGFSLPHGSPWY